MIHTALYAVTGAFLASLLRGFTGFGFVMSAVPLISLALPPTEVVPLVILLQIEVGLMDLRAAVRLCDWPSLAWLVPGMVIGTPIGLLVLTSLSANSARLAIGLLIAGSVAVLARGVRLPPRPSRAVTVGVGMVSGTMNGMAGISGPPVMAYLLARPIDTAAVRASAIVFFMVTASVALVPMADKGLVTRQELIWALAASPVLFLGSRLGAWGFRRTEPRHHRATALIVLSVLAASLILRALVRA
ncbi:MAG: sulfite exporter TauE/SafE family protein [Rhodospirillales bacterium]|nr:sulfite exporter TauE/SafE family protein [Rhodospirillales bacterium]